VAPRSDVVGYQRYGRPSCLSLLSLRAYGMVLS